MKKYHIIFLLALLILASSCENFFEPAPDGRLTDKEMLNSPSFIEGLLLKAYQALPNSYTFGIDVASDDAVSNQQNFNYTRMATGEWKSSFSPVSAWSNAYQQIFHVNLFLDMYEKVNFGRDPRVSQEENERKNSLHKKRLKGEAYGLRAWYQFELLQAHSGKTADGQLLGFPIITHVITIEDDWKLPRNTFAQCVQQIMEDIDTAIANLPPVYADIANDGIHNITMGARFENRMTGNAARALKSKVALLAASPAYSAESGVTWADAAEISGKLLLDLGAIYANGVRFYIEVKSREIIWNRAKQNIRSWEQNNFPPSLFGNGRINPSQSLVDAFPARDGYPIHLSPLYDPANPYANRDTRLGHYIIHDGASFKGQTIQTHLGADLNGINNLITSTRTGYYLKKFMLEAVNLTPGNLTSSDHTYVLLRMTEVILNFAEAANEAWGPEGDPLGLGFNAKDKIRELRQRAVITQPDAYLNSLTSTDDLRALIRNERRIELCFEGNRFWDIRRWMDTEKMTEPVYGVFINKSELPVQYNFQKVEDRIYAPYMVFGPIPFDETRKYDLKQNANW
jgi:starch-binding outer membrane protein, SusD/RagB family